MLLKFAIIFAALSLDVIKAEAPLDRNSAPYPSAGWRPNTPFNLPREYLPPTTEFEPQQNIGSRQQQAYDIEIRKQRVDFVGQVQDNVLVRPNQRVNTPQNAYLPPVDDEFLKVQSLPQTGRPQQFIQSPPSQRKFNRPQQRPTTQLGARLEPPSSTQQAFFPSPQSADLPAPAQEYGAPDLDSNLPEPRQLQADVREVSAQQEENRAAINALNAAAEAYNRARDTSEQTERDEDELDENEGPSAAAGYPSSSAQQRGSRFTQGQYYVLGPDNTVQRVMFSTTQDEQDQRNNGFTAKLRYTPVGEVRDPVFKYNNQGQLVRLFK